MTDMRELVVGILRSLIATLDQDTSDPERHKAWCDAVATLRKLEAEIEKDKA